MYYYKEEYTRSENKSCAIDAYIRRSLVFKPDFFGPTDSLDEIVGLQKLFLSPIQENLVLADALNDTFKFFNPNALNDYFGRFGNSNSYQYIHIKRVIETFFPIMEWDGFLDVEYSSRSTAVWDVKLKDLEKRDVLFAVPGAFSTQRNLETYGIYDKIKVKVWLSDKECVSMSYLKMRQQFLNIYQFYYSKWDQKQWEIKHNN